MNDIDRLITEHEDDDQFELFKDSSEIVFVEGGDLLLRLLDVTYTPKIKEML
jgi:hypothetical protein